MTAGLKSLGEAVRALQIQAAEAAGRADGLRGQAETLAQRLVDHEEQQRVLTQVGVVLSAMELAWRKSFEEALTAMVSRGLTLVLGEPVHFSIVSAQRAGTPTLEFRLSQNGLETDIMEAKGGTVVALVTFLLRLAVVLATQPPLRKTLVLDEAFAHVSTEYVPALAALIRQLCDETGVQCILVTHEPAYGDAADVVYGVSQRQGISTYERLKARRDIA